MDFRQTQGEEDSTLAGGELASAARRSFMLTAGKYALTVPPTMTLLLATTMSSPAIAKSGSGVNPGGGGDGGGGGGGGGDGGPPTAGSPGDNPTGTPPVSTTPNPIGGDGPGPGGGGFASASDQGGAPGLYRSGPQQGGAAGPSGSQGVLGAPASPPDVFIPGRGPVADSPPGTVGILPGKTFGHPRKIGDDILRAGERG